jgi:hypothetical protein
MITLYRLVITDPDGRLHPRCDEKIWNVQWFSTLDDATQEFERMVEECITERDSTVEVVSREFSASEHAPCGTTVILDEEHGVATWIWDSGLTPEELVKYWSALLSVDHLYINLKRLPGTIVRALPTRSRGIVLSKEGKAAIMCGEGAWASHLWRDNDSWLQDAEGNRIRHKGFQENGHLYEWV